MLRSFRPLLLLPLLLKATAGADADDAAQLRGQPTSPWTESLPSADDRECDEAAVQLRGAPRLLEKGSLVELCADGSDHATPAIVTGHCTGSGESQGDRFYGIEDVYAKEHLPRVDAQFVRPYEVYEDGTRATCNVGEFVRFEKPCGVVGHTKRPSGVALYEVLYLDGDDETVREILPFSRVRRRGGVPGTSLSEVRRGDRSFQDWFRTFYSEAIVTSAIDF